MPVYSIRISYSIHVHETTASCKEFNALHVHVHSLIEVYCIETGRVLIFSF